MVQNLKKAAKNKQIVMMVLVCAIIAVGAWNYIGSMNEAVPVAGQLASDDLASAVYDDNGEYIYVTSPIPTEASDYFSRTRIDREQARSRAFEVLEQMIANDDVAQDARDQAQDEMRRMARAVESEAIIESLIVARGFEDAVTFITESGVNVVVQEEGLTASQVAQIQEIVISQTNAPSSQITIVEIR